LAWRNGRRDSLKKSSSGAGSSPAASLLFAIFKFLVKINLFKKLIKMYFFSSIFFFKNNDKKINISCFFFYKNNNFFFFKNFSSKCIFFFVFYSFFGSNVLFFFTPKLSVKLDSNYDYKIISSYQNNCFFINYNSKSQIVFKFFFFNFFPIVRYYDFYFDYFDFYFYNMKINSIINFQNNFFYDGSNIFKDFNVVPRIISSKNNYNMGFYDFSIYLCLHW
jgi:hypothetical protein